MKVLVLGGGGREHALVRALNLSDSVHSVFCSPGSDAIAKEAEFISVSHTETHSLVEKVKNAGIDLVVVGPEAPLAEGVADNLRDGGVLVFGPSQRGAELESSKLRAKKFMSSAGVPTARYEVVSSADETMSASKTFNPPYVLKFDGLAAGKGVFICKDEAELRESAKLVFETEQFESKGEKVALLEQFHEGWELSFLVLTNGKSFEALPLMQDHKRLNDGDLGPNTGGMGAVGPIDLDSNLKEQIINEIVAPSIARLELEGIDFRGVLYIGVMVTPEGPQVLEYNVRFGDPEVQGLLPLLDGDWGLAFKEIASGEVPSLKWKDLYSSVVVIAAEGYPDAPIKGRLIQGSLLSRSEEGHVLHAGTRIDPQSGWVTNGGRVLNAVGLGTTISEAIDRSYKIVEDISCEGMQVRRDIGKRQVSATDK